MKAVSSATLTCIVALLPLALGYKPFQNLIPNGDLVPHPCKPNFIWQGVGHLGQGGGGDRNPFGQDFTKNLKKWDKCLCEYDSDGDGRTNGEELGDPDCLWEPGKVPARNTGLSHPGICEPLDDPNCQLRNNIYSALCDNSAAVAECLEPIKNMTGIVEWPLVMPPTDVPAQETTYMCTYFAAPDVTQDYHAIAYQPSINNANILHHITISGCADDNIPVTGQPEECGMAAENCRSLIFVWSVGITGQCWDEAFGFRIGLNGFKRVLMQVHWNNPELRDDYTDGSGLVIYLTPNLRPNDGAMLIVGQRYLQIPGNKQDVKQEGNCSSVCTEKLSQSVYLASSAIHMHYLGNKGYIEHFRNGTKMNDLVQQDDYSYDTPISHIHSPAIELAPGDEFRTSCHYKSTSRDYTTYHGDSTAAEMCYGFITYYPAQPEFTGCLQFRSQPLCVRSTSQTAGQVFDGCDFDGFSNRSQEIFNNIATYCDVTGETCLPECETLMSDYAINDPCMTGDAYYMLKDIFLTYYGPVGQALVNYLVSCEVEEEDNVTTLDEDKEETDAGENSKILEGEDSHEFDDRLCPVVPQATPESNPGGGGLTGGAVMQTYSSMCLLVVLLMIR